jgi:hypothetical protein
MLGPVSPAFFLGLAGAIRHKRRIETSGALGCREGEEDLWLLF